MLRFLAWLCYTCFAPRMCQASFWGRGIEYRSFFSSFLIIGCNLMLTSDDCFLFNLTILVLDPFRRAHTAPMDQFAAFSGATAFAVDEHGTWEMLSRPGIFQNDTSSTATVTPSTATVTPSTINSWTIRFLELDSSTVTAFPTVFFFGKRQSDASLLWKGGGFTVGQTR